MTQGTKQVVSDGEFLLDRIDELDWTDSSQFERDWHGHVAPALARFRDSLNDLKGSLPSD